MNCPSSLLIGRQGAVAAMVFPTNVARWDKDALINVELIAETFSDYDAMIAYRDALLQRH